LRDEQRVPANFNFFQQSNTPSMANLTVDGRLDSQEEDRGKGIFRRDTSLALLHRGNEPTHIDLCGDRPTEISNRVAGSRGVAESEKINIGICCSGGGIRSAGKEKRIEVFVDFYCRFFKTTCSFVKHFVSEDYWHYEREDCWERLV
jgi:hypothetical protein